MPIIIMKAKPKSDNLTPTKRGRGRPRKPMDTTRSPRANGHAKIRAPIVPIDQPCRLFAGNVCAVGGISVPKLNQMIAEGTMPAPHYDGRRRWWPSAEIREAFGL